MTIVIVVVVTINLIRRDQRRSANFDPTEIDVGIRLPTPVVKHAVTTPYRRSDRARLTCQDGYSSPTKSQTKPRERSRDKATTGVPPIDRRVPFSARLQYACARRTINLRWRIHHARRRSLIVPRKLRGLASARCGEMLVDASLRRYDFD